jgi:hypothetical protein
MNAGAATPKAKADVRLRRVKFVIISSTHRPDSRVLKSKHPVFKDRNDTFVYGLILERTFTPRRHLVPDNALTLIPSRRKLVLTRNNRDALKSVKSPQNTGRTL